MSHDGIVVLPRFSLKSWRVIGAWSESEQNRGEKFSEKLDGKV
jgi:hypothetical protein